MTFKKATTTKLGGNAYQHEKSCYSFLLGNLIMLVKATAYKLALI